MHFTSFEPDPKGISPDRRKGKIEVVGGNWNSCWIVDALKSPYIALMDLDTYLCGCTYEKLDPESLVYIYWRFDNKLYFQRTCRKKYAVSLIGECGS